MSRWLQILDFDPVTKFRLINAFLVAIGISALAPVLTVLKGTLLPVWVISMFGIGNTLVVKTNAYFSKKSLDWLYKVGIGVHIFFTLSAVVYFFSPLGMVILGSISGIIEVAIFSAYAIRLNAYLADNFPETTTKFGITRNNTWANGHFIGLGVSAFVTAFWGLTPMIILFVMFNTMFSAWMIYNWNFYQNRGL